MEAMCLTATITPSPLPRPVNKIVRLINIDVGKAHDDDDDDDADENGGGTGNNNIFFTLVEQTIF